MIKAQHVESDSDASPPRRRKDAPAPTCIQEISSDASPPRRQRFSTLTNPRDGDLSDSSAFRRPRRKDRGELAREISVAHHSAENKFGEGIDSVDNRNAALLRDSRHEYPVDESEHLKLQDEDEVSVSHIARKVHRDDDESARQYPENLHRSRNVREPVAELDIVHRSEKRWGDPLAWVDGHITGSAVHRLSSHSRVIGNSAIARSREEYNGPPAPPNRFNIAPGPRWDGVDRSNGFERRIVENRLAKSARDDAAYRRDMSGL